MPASSYETVDDVLLDVEPSYRVHIEDPDSTVLTDGSHVTAYVVTSSFGGNSSAVAAKLQDPTGAVIKSFEIELSGLNSEPDLAATADGGFLVTTTVMAKQFSTGPAGQGDIYLWRFDSTGDAVQPPVRVNADLDDYSGPATQADRQSSVTELSNGSVAVAWTSMRSGSADIYVSTFTAGFDAIQQDILVNLSTAGTQDNPIITALSGGRFMVAWETDAFAGQTGKDELHAQIFDSSGARIGGEFEINTLTDGLQDQASADTLVDGNTVVVWESNQLIKGQLFDPAGNKIGGEFVVAPQMYYQSAPEVEAHPDGGFIVTWNDAGLGLSGRSFDAGATPLADAYTLVEGNVGAYEFDLSGENGIAVSYYIDGQLHSRTLTTALADITGTPGDDVLEGNSLDNTISGLAGDDILHGGRGADRLVGGDGTDTATYAGDFGGVFVNLTLGQGFTNYAFGDTYESIENVVGSSYDDFLIGDGNVNRLDGAAGNDTIIGAVGADVLIGGDGIDLLSYEDNSGVVFVNLLTGKGFNNAAQGDTFEGFENVIGGLFDDTLIGDNGDNRLDGAMGADTLVGNGGADTFVFAHAPSAPKAFDSPNASANVDTIFDFVSGEDVLEISASAFGGGLAAGSLAGDQFLVGSAAGDANDRFVYDQATGQLYFDADGSGAGEQVLVAILPNHDMIAASDFVIV